MNPQNLFKKFFGLSLLVASLCSVSSRAEVFTAECQTDLSGGTEIKTFSSPLRAPSDRYHVGSTRIPLFNVLIRNATLFCDSVNYGVVDLLFLNMGLATPSLGYREKDTFSLFNVLLNKTSASPYPFSSDLTALGYQGQIMGASISKIRYFYGVRASGNPNPQMGRVLSLDRFSYKPEEASVMPILVVGATVSLKVAYIKTDSSRPGIIDEITINRDEVIDLSGWDFQQ